MTLSGKLRCHQNFNAIENHPALSMELLPIIVVKGVHRMRCAIGVSQSIPESGLNL
jgi:hypothetical protein